MINGAWSLGWGLTPWLRPCPVLFYGSMSWASSSLMSVAGIAWLMVSVCENVKRLESHPFWFVAGLFFTRVFDDFCSQDVCCKRKWNSYPERAWLPCEKPAIAHIALQKHGSYSYYLHPWTNLGFHIRSKVIYVTYVLWSQTCSWKQRVHFLKNSAWVSGHNAVGSHPFVSIMHLLCMDSQIRQLQLVELNASGT